MNSVEKSSLVEKLFFVSQEGKLDQFIRGEVRAYMRLAPILEDVRGNVYNITSLLEWTSHLRDMAARALPDGHLLAIPRAEIERMHGPQTWTRK